MSPEFKYMKECVSADLTLFLIVDYNLSLSDALDILYESETYSKLSNPDTGLYFRGSRYVYSYLQNELQTGVFN